MSKQTIDLLSDQAKQDEQLKYQIEQGLLTNSTYQGMTANEQSNVRQVLFEMYSSPVDTASALSGLEFTVFGLAKLFFKLVPSSANLTADEQAFYTNLNNLVQQHEITLNGTDWYVPYAQNKMLSVKDNRATYKQQKVNITGSF